MDFKSTLFKKNFVVAVLACVVSYLILVGATLIEVNFSGWGELIRAEYEGRTTEEIAGEIDVFAEMESVVVRIKFLYVPLALVLPALGIALGSSGWNWSWLLTLIGCAPGLIALALTADTNLGVGVVFAILAYFVIACLETWWRYSRRDLNRPNTSFQRTLTRGGFGPLNSDR
jgi:hypothetical protein